MKNQLATIREAIAVAQKNLATLREGMPKDMLPIAELDELDMGLEWSMRRIERVGVQMEIYRRSREVGS